MHNFIVIFIVITVTRAVGQIIKIVSDGRLWRWSVRPQAVKMKCLADLAHLAFHIISVSHKICLNSCFVFYVQTPFREATPPRADCDSVNSSLERTTISWSSSGETVTSCLLPCTETRITSGSRLGWILHTSNGSWKICLKSSEALSHFEIGLIVNISKSGLVFLLIKNSIAEWMVGICSITNAIENQRIYLFIYLFYFRTQMFSEDVAIMHCATELLSRSRVPGFGPFLPTSIETVDSILEYCRSLATGFEQMNQAGDPSYDIASTNIFLKNHLEKIKMTDSRNWLDEIDHQPLHFPCIVTNMGSCTVSYIVG